MFGRQCGREGAEWEGADGGECDVGWSPAVIGEVRVLEGEALEGRARELVGHRMLVVQERVDAVERRLELRLGALGGVLGR